MKLNEMKYFAMKIVLAEIRNPACKYQPRRDEILWYGDKGGG